jgi:phage recombination protein Bet
MSNTDVATTQERPVGVTQFLADKYGMDVRAFEATVRATMMKPDKNGRAPTREEFAAYMLVAKEYNLNPITREIFAFADPKRGGVIPVISVDGWIRIINQHPMMDGIAFQERVNDKDVVTAVTCSIMRKDRGHPIIVTEYLAECRRDTDPWKRWPRRMLRHKALIQCARIAFGYQAMDEDEAEKLAAELAVDVTASDRPSMRGAAGALAAIEARAPVRDTTSAPIEASHDDSYDPETGEITQSNPSAPASAQTSDAANSPVAATETQGPGNAPQPGPASEPAIVAAAREKARHGMSRLNLWRKTLSKEDEAALNDFNTELFEIAKAVDAAKSGG